jgi:hypothetical protein
MNARRMGGAPGRPRKTTKAGRLRHQPGPGTHQENPNAAAKETPVAAHFSDRGGGLVYVRGGAVFVTAEAYMPSGRRGLWTYIVTDCPRADCGVHFHRGPAPRPEGHRRRAPCGQRYVILARPAVAVVA